MTSFIIKAHENRSLHPRWDLNPECTFCRIIKRELPASIVYENDQVIAFLDILPLRKGHTLVVPKAHISRLSELPSELAAAIGASVTKVAHTLTLALENTALNVVCNQEYAQAVPHVHYHVIPAPRFDWTPRSMKSTDEAVKPIIPLTHREMHAKEYEAREELDEEEAVVLLGKIRARL